QTVNANATVTLLDNPSTGTSVTVASSATGGSNVGIGASSGTGAISINTGNNNAVAVSGDNSFGLWGESAAGNVTVLTGTNSTITVTPNASGNVSENPRGFVPGSVGIVAGIDNPGTTGFVSVTNNAAITVSNQGPSNTLGVYAF